MKRWIYRKDNIVLVFRLGTTRNRKITAGGHAILQTYTLSRDQYDWARMGGRGIAGFLERDTANCLDCPFSRHAGNGGCYTHKLQQASGLLEMTRAVVRTHPDWTGIPLIPALPPADLIDAASDRYIRWGTYGEPSLIPVKWVEILSAVAGSYTGYTHQWMKDWAQEYRRFFMASVHSLFEDTIATDMGWRSFIATKEKHDRTIVHCPASKESNYKTSCEVCALCSGTEGKGTKSVAINEH